MSLLFSVLAAILSTLLSLFGRKGVRSVVAEMILLRSQLIILKRKSSKIYRLTPWQRLVLGATAHFIPKGRIGKISILLSPATILKFHNFLVRKKYAKLYASRQSNTARPTKSKEIIDLVIEIKTQNPSFGCPRIAMIIMDRTGHEICEETVRNILLKHFHPTPGKGPSWLSFIGNQIDSLWSIDLFRVESVLLKTHWILVCMDQYSRKIIGFAVCKEIVTEILCRMFNEVLEGTALPKHIGRDHDPLFRSYRWQSLIRILELDEVKGVPFVPTSRPFIERLIGTVRREFTDQILFWNQYDLKRKLEQFKTFYNESRVHYSLNGKTPDSVSKNTSKYRSVGELSWKSYCSGLYYVPMAA